MPIYDFRNSVTGEERLNEMMSIADRIQFLQDNPDWEQLINQTGGLISDHKSPLTRAGSEWQDTLKAIKKNNAPTGQTINV